MNQQIQVFDPQSIQFGEKAPIIFIYGRRDTGKTTLIKDLLSIHNNVSVGAIVSSARPCEYLNYAPDILHDEFNEIIPENIAERQRTMANPNSFLVLDHCLYDGTFLKGNAFYKIMTHKYHRSLGLILSDAYPMGPSPVLQSNINYIFILQESLKNNRKMYYEKYASFIPSFQIFNDLMDRYTVDFGCLVIDNTVQSDQWQDRIFWYRAGMNQHLYDNSYVLK